MEWTSAEYKIMTRTYSVPGALFAGAMALLFVSALVATFATAMLIEWASSRYVVYALFAVLMAWVSTSDTIDAVG